MDPRGLRKTQNSYFSFLRHTLVYLINVQDEMKYPGRKIGQKLESFENLNHLWIDPNHYYAHTRLGMAKISTFHLNETLLEFKN